VIVDELLQRDVAASVAEQRLVWVEDDPQRPLRPDVIRAAQAAGYAVDVLSPRALAARYGAIAAPLLVIADERGRVRYVGGYGARKRDGQPRDRELLAAVARGDELTALPILGCATSRELQRQLDPLGLKYRSSP
jgi:hypothetical protein